MRILVKVIIYSMTVRLLSVAGNKVRDVPIKYGDDDTPVEINCHIGETVQIKCYYPPSHESNDKFLCMGEDPYSCERLIDTTDEDRDVTIDRFHIRDNRRMKYFYVYINNLDTNDTGSYWCCSSMSENKYPEILLSVAENHMEIPEPDHPPLQKTKLSATSEHRSDVPQTAAENHMEIPEPDHPPLQKTTLSATSEHRSDVPQTADMIAAAVVCPALLLILVLVLILCRHKLPRTRVCCAAGGSSEQRTNAEHNKEGNHENHPYEEIEIQNQQASSGNAPLTVYATVNLAADQLHYPAVNFQEDSFIVSTDGNALPDTSKKDSPACVYSLRGSEGDTHPPAAEQTLF